MIDHDELFACTGLKHGTGAICCGCPRCGCLNCYLKRISKYKMNGGSRGVG
ncbi:MAG: hypothetical protein IMZ43_08090 [Thermoplasmata archaeon]|nr:hypothetical protein [Thermoplasmata archaeon]